MSEITQLIRGEVATVRKRTARRESEMAAKTLTDVGSANNFIHAGYRLFMPACPWGWANTLYWQKDTAVSSWLPELYPAAGR